jgi:cell division protein FtsB
MVRQVIARVSPGRLVRPLFFVFVLFYFSYHLAHGERGLFALVRQERQLDLLTREMERVHQERLTVERKVAYLRGDALDLDLLDEQMRRLLGMMKPGELVVLLPPAPAESAR